MAITTALEKALEQSVSQSGSPGSAVYVGQRDQTLFSAATGSRQTTPKKLPATTATVYDLASLTKTVATATATMLLRDQGILDLDAPIVEHVPIPAFKAVTTRHLLTHTGGFASSMLAYRDYTSMTEMIHHVAQNDFEGTPGEAHSYSDVGFMVLGLLMELAAKQTLDRYCRDHVFAPLGMNDTCFKPPEDWKDRCAATEDCPWRGYVVRGVVHDEAAFAAGGVAGHAGLFSTIGDLALFCRALLEGTLLPAKTIKEMIALAQVPSYPWQGLGWHLDPWLSEVQGALPARGVFGHSGWTGTSLWVDYASGLFCIQLGNTCHPTRKGRNNKTFRQVFYTAVADTLYENQRAVHTGLDVIIRERFRPLRRESFALLTNGAATDMMGRSILDVLDLDDRLNLRLLYGPEHGLRGQAEAGEAVASEDGAVPIVSLYGERKAPSPEELKNIDLFVIDLPDVGARYYTYMATMKNCLEACAKYGTPVLVLDRPNPLGGIILEGPIARNTDSVVCCAPIPVRHAMTMGELATFFADQISPKLKLRVLQAEAWLRRLQFEACSLPWVAPSPNMPTVQTALVYVGTCLFEGTNLNEGRGTSTPFQRIGAPWIDSRRVLDAMDEEAQAGCAIEAIEYTPHAIPGKSANPRYKDELCSGIYIRVEDTEAFRPFSLAVALLSAIVKTHPGKMEWLPFFDVLAGSEELRAAIAQGVPPLEIVAGYADELARFDSGRPKIYE
jgi:uncharacterized protein YbbC (DUF1343 family)